MPASKRTTLPAENSLWFRPMRPLIDEGSPVGQTLLLCFKGIEEMGALPFCALTMTKNGRLIAWPILPTATTVAAIDHVTLEFPSRRMHATGFTVAGERTAMSKSWKTQPFPEANVELWFRFVIRTDVISRQERLIERSLKMPTVDAERRKHEFVRYASDIHCIDVNLPAAAQDGDYVVGCFYLLIDDTKPPALTSDVFLSGGEGEAIDEWPDGVFCIGQTLVKTGATVLLLASARPPGRAKDDVILAFPRRG